MVTWLRVVLSSKCPWNTRTSSRLYITAPGPLAPEGLLTIREMYGLHRL